MAYETVLKLTKSDFENLPNRHWNEPVYCDAIVLIPTENKHDSGYNCIEVVAMDDDKPICYCAGGSDVIDINGIGGYGELYSKAFQMYNDKEKVTPASSWHIDLLPCGYFRLFVSGHRIKIGESLSDLEIYSVGNYTDIEEIKNGNR